MRRFLQVECRIQPQIGCVYLQHHRGRVRMDGAPKQMNNDDDASGEPKRPDCSFVSPFPLTEFFLFVNFIDVSLPFDIPTAECQSFLFCFFLDFFFPFFPFFHFLLLLLLFFFFHPLRNSPRGKRCPLFPDAIVVRPL